MPGAAVAMDAAHKVVPLGDMSRAILRSFERSTPNPQKAAAHGS
jgi:hypothetical protein